MLEFINPLQGKAKWYLQHAAEAEHQRPVLRTDVEVGERRLRLVAAGWLRGRCGGQCIALLCQDAVTRVAASSWAQAAVAQQQIEAPRAEVSQPP